jgi:hypothetical protein
MYPLKLENPDPSLTQKTQFQIWNPTNPSAA